MHQCSQVVNGHSRLRLGTCVDQFVCCPFSGTAGRVLTALNRRLIRAPWHNASYTLPSGCRLSYGPTSSTERSTCPPVPPFRTSGNALSSPAIPRPLVASIHHPPVPFCCSTMPSLRSFRLHSISLISHPGGGSFGVFVLLVEIETSKTCWRSAEEALYAL